MFHVFHSSQVLEGDGDPRVSLLGVLEDVLGKLHEAHTSLLVVVVLVVFDEGEEFEVADHCPQVGDEEDVLADEIEDHSCQADEEGVGFRDELDDHSCQADEEVSGFDKEEDAVHCCQAVEDDDGLGEVEDDHSCQAEEDDVFVYEVVALVH